MAFHTLLIANRGEIAGRILETAQELGYRVVCVFSEADADMPYVRAADAAVCIGPAPVAQSYLDIEAILAAAHSTGADAVHPGYGFLSENADFARACVAAGLVWVGPPPAAMEAMGDKARARQLMKAAGVDVVPGYDGADQSDSALIRAAEEIGYPLLVKASAGGGGRGMRRVGAPAQLAEALSSARRESLGAFGDDRLLLEKLVEGARHVEVQVLADDHGTAIHVGERDCSVQRRYQKVIEEAPAVGSELRARMGEAAVAAARAIEYRGAGTVEFLLDPDDRFYFLEMNTRLQVEHPVTELVYGVDLVEQQLRVAAGLPLSPIADQPTGHAIEARLYAEDPWDGYLPQTGRIVAFESAAIARCDHQLEAGAEISAFYDPMIAKVIAFGPDRETARRALQRALEQTVLLGVRTNKAFLGRVLGHADFVSGAVTTAWLEAASLPAPVADSAAMATLVALWLGDAGGAWRNAGDPSFPLELTLHGSSPSSQEYRVAPDGLSWRVTVGDAEHRVRLLSWIGPRARVEVDGVQRTVHALREGERLHVDLDGVLVGPVSERLHADSAEESAGTGTLIAHISGAVVAVDVEVGAVVVEGDRALVLEAMKIESPVRCDVSGTVTEVRVVSGQRVDRGTVLVVIAPT